MRRRVPLFATVALLALCLAPAARADFGFKEGSLDLNFQDQDGALVSQAASHPFAMHNTLAINTVINLETGKEVPDGGEVKDLRIELPRGLVADPDAVAHCSAADFLDVTASLPACPDGSALGVAEVTIGFGEPKEERYPIYNLIAAPGEVAKLGFIAISGIPVTIDVHLKPATPYNGQVLVADIAQSAFFYGTDTEIWGNPAGSVHDPDRGYCALNGGTCKAGVPERPFFTTPAYCAAPLRTVFAIDPWADPGAWVTGEAETHGEDGEPLGMTGCSKVDFDADVEAQPTSRSADSATGLDLTIDVDDKGLVSPREEAVAFSQIREARVTMPPGMTANPSAANGLGTCSQAQFGLGEEGAPACPDASKLGTVEVQSPLLEGKTLRGGVYLATPRENPFGTLLALYMAIEEPQTGIRVKLPGRIDADPKTGQLTTTFGEAPYEIPQVPFSSFRFHFREGARAPLVTPPSCGTYQAKAEFVPWANPGSPLVREVPFVVEHGPGGGSCPSSRPFAPGFEAGAQENGASTYSPFYMRLTRKDGEADISRFSAVLPPGVAGKIAGVPTCPDAAIEAAKQKTAAQELANPSCPAASAVGRVLAGAGVGSILTYVPGTLYLAGPYGGDQLSIVAIIPAKAGPFDVGTVVTRVALQADIVSGQVQIDGSHSDPIPQILEGIPLRVRDIRIYADREGFTFNATGCEREAAQATITGSTDPFSLADDFGQGREVSYQAADCARLGFGPRIAFKLKGGTKRSKHPALNSTLTFPYQSGPGYSNIARAVVVLPHSIFIDPEHVNNPCTRVQFAEDACPSSTVLGTARAVTPLLDQPLEGPVYFRSNGGEGGRKVPDIVADLNGQFHITLIGAVDSLIKKNGDALIRTTFFNAPDLPVTRFTLNLQGGKTHGLLVNSENLCSHAQRAQVNFTAHSGATEKLNPLLKTKCKRAKGNKRRAPAGHGQR